MKLSIINFSVLKASVVFLICFLFCAANLFAETNAWGGIKKIRPSIIGVDHYGDDSFGCSVAMDGDTAIVGASWYNKGYGFAYIFERNTGGANAWSEVKRLSASDAEMYKMDLFGASVAIDDNVAIVGAPNSGAYIFERNTGGANAWGEVKKITASDAEEYYRFGSSVAVAGDIAIVGAPYDDSNGSAAGAAYVFERNFGGINAWGEVKKLTAFDAEAYDEFGYSVAAEGDIVIAGAWKKNPGVAYVFRQDKNGINAWGEVKKLTATSERKAYGFGNAVAIDGDHAVIGAYFAEVGTPLNVCGAAYVFEGTDGGNQVAILTASDAQNGDYFGSSVAIADDIVIVGAERAHVASDNGAAYIFRRDEDGPNAWGEVKKLTAYNVPTWDNNIQFGCSVAVGNDVMFVGAEKENTHWNDATGITYIFGKYGPAPSETFADAQTLSSDSAYSGLAIGSNSGATIDPGEPAHAGNGGPYHSVWWNWSGPANALMLEATPGDTLLVDTHDSDFDTVLAIYTGAAVNSLTQIAANDNAGTGIETSEVSFQFNSGETYHIVVDGKTDSDTGNIVMNYAIIPEPGFYLLFICNLGLWIIYSRRPLGPGSPLSL